MLWLDEIGEGDGPRVGGKALALARLRREGLPVPDAFVVTAGSGLDGAVLEAVAAAYARLGGPVAVRSSSTAEDLPAASFAGQYKTLLDVEGAAAVLAAVEACLGSAADATVYAAALGVPGTGDMAVLVQRFVEPRAAGVVFTRHPQDAGCLLVESYAGRGEELVSGRVTPDRYVLDRATGARRDAAGSSLGAGDLDALAGLAQRAEDLLGSPQDVEWAIGPEGPVVLQSRPITVEADERPDPRLRRLTRANVGEVLPDPVTPLTWTTVGAFLEHAFRTVTAETGLLPEKAPPFLALHRRRLYLNLSLCVDVAARLPGISAADAERLILGGGATGAGAGRGFGPGLRPGLVLVGARLARLGARLPSEIEACEERVRGFPSREAIAAAEMPVLAGMVRGFAAVGRALATTHVATSGASAFRLALLGRIVSFVTGGDSTERVNRLLAGLEGVLSAAPAEALEALADEAASRPEWLAWLARPAGEAARAFAGGAAPAGLAARVRAFLDRFGHRALSEGELSADAWEDDPTPVFAALSTLGASPGSGSFRRRGRAEARRADEEALVSRLGPVSRPIVRWALTGAQSWVRERERTKSIAVAMIHHGRSLVRAAAQRLVTSGALRRGDDVYFLTLDELVAALDGRPVPGSVVARRWRRHQREGSLPAPRQVDLALEDAVDPASASGVLDGTGVSAGVGLGPARVVGHGEALRLEPGEVLVAPVLDAALGPLLSSASAAVAEIGGMLSHGSVVARELGIPCVVDVRDATRRIRTGDQVLVDGGSGRVRAWPAGEAPPAEAGPPAVLAACGPENEGLHPLEDHPLARESVYFNVQDPAAGVAIVASLGLRPGGRGEALLAVSLPDGRVLFGLELDAARFDARGLRVGGMETRWGPVRLRFDGALAPHESRGFPPPPLTLLLTPRTVDVALDLTLAPTTPAIDYCQGLSADVLDRLQRLGRHHVEQSGRFDGTLSVDGRRLAFAGTGSRDHSWGLRDWEAVDHWRLFSVRLGDDLAVHALAVSAEGRMVEGGFLWRDGRAERITRVEYTAERTDGRVCALELLVSTAAGLPLRLLGTVERTISVPVQPERRPWRHLAGRPYRLVLHEHYTRYEAEGRVGHGMAEFTERPL